MQGVGQFGSASLLLPDLVDGWTTTARHRHIVSPMVTLTGTLRGRAGARGSGGDGFASATASSNLVTRPTLPPLSVVLAQINGE